MRAELIRKIDDYQKKNSKLPGKRCSVEWFGLPYLEICKLEKIEAENRVKDEIREEIESKRRKNV